MPAPLTTAVWRHPPKNVIGGDYNLEDVQLKIVHLGPGVFARGLLFEIVDESLRRGLSKTGICAIGMTPYDEPVHNGLDGQNGLYTLTTTDGTRMSHRLIGAVRLTDYTPDTPAASTARLALPNTEIVTVTATPGGYHLDADGNLDLSHNRIVNDLANPDHPRTVYGHLVNSFQLRMKDGRGGPTVLSFDELPHNGDKLRNGLLSFCAEHRRPDIGRWIQDHVTFPNSVSDRRTPQTTDAMRSLIETNFGLTDQVPVLTERYWHLAIEDNFAGDRPPWDDIGVQFVNDIGPWNHIKGAIFDASLTAIGYLAALQGVQFIDTVTANPLYTRYINSMLEREILPHMPRVTGLNLVAYGKMVLHRLSNPHNREGVANACRNGSVRVPRLVLNTIQTSLARRADSKQNGAPIGRLVLCVAAWLRYLNGFDEQGNTIKIADPQSDKLMGVVRQYGKDMRPIVAALPEIFGELADVEDFIGLLQHFANPLHEIGVEQTLAFVNQ